MSDELVVIDPEEDLSPEEKEAAHASEVVPYLNELNIKQVRAFWMTWEGKDRREIAEALKVAPSTVTSWKRLPAWIKAMEAEVQIRNGEFHAGMLQLDDKAIAMAERIYDGTDPESKIANAQVGLLRVRAEIGRSPLINRRPVEGGVVIEGDVTVNQQNNFVTTGWTPEEILEYQQSKTIPERFKNGGNGKSDNSMG